MRRNAPATLLVRAMCRQYSIRSIPYSVLRIRTAAQTDGRSQQPPHQPSSRTTQEAPRHRAVWRGSPLLAGDDHAGRGCGCWLITPHFAPLSSFLLSRQEESVGTQYSKVALLFVADVSCLAGNEYCPAIHSVGPRLGVLWQGNR